MYLHDETHIHEPAKKHLGISKNGEDVAEGDFALGSVAAHICLQSRLDVRAFFLVQPFGLLRAVSDALSD